MRAQHVIRTIHSGGDQTTLELVRMVAEQGGCYFLDKDKKGDFTTCENVH